MTAAKALPVSIQKIENILSTTDESLDEVFSLNGFKESLRKRNTPHVNVIMLRTGANTPVLNFRFLDVFHKIHINKLLLFPPFYQKT